ncbi:MAG: hypothetical protein A4E53_01709 [Pelotomaculum sp. PtaB.Bin104]|nr:MAG: hypothetical protein A4E53_01709 [Pelotomaculum sp. PtaB.Bin104]
MTKKTLYHCSTCRSWNGTDEICRLCGKPCDKKDVPNKRGGLYYIGEVDKPLISVTSILSALSKPQLMPWAARVAATYAFKNPGASLDEAVSQIYKSRDKAGSEGTQAHKCLEYIEAGGTHEFMNPPSKVDQYVMAYYKWKDAFPHKFMPIEHTVYSKKYGYAGTLDAIVEDSSGKTWLIDFKTSNGIYNEMGLQLVAYKTAVEEMGLCKVDHMGILQLVDDGTFNFKEMNEPLKTFLALKLAYEWQNKLN